MITTSAQIRHRPHGSSGKRRTARLAWPLVAAALMIPGVALADTMSAGARVDELAPSPEAVAPARPSAPLTPASAPKICTGGPWTPVPFNGATYERRLILLKTGPACRSIFAAKLAYKAREISPQDYEDNVWVLKQWREHEIMNAKIALAQMKINKFEYKMRVADIDQQYAGK